MIKCKDESLNKKVNQVLLLANKTLKQTPNLRDIYKDIEKFDTDTRIHCDNVAYYATLIGVAYNFNLNKLINLCIGAKIHDCGKIMLDPDIQNQPKKFSQNERVYIEAHTTKGYHLVKNLPIDGVIKDIVKKHHEKTDGSGYPDGEDASDVSISVQIVTIADIFDAMVSKRVYKNAIDIKDAFKEIENSKGLNQTAVTIFKESLLGGY